MNKVLMQQALDALIFEVSSSMARQSTFVVIEAFRTELAKPEPEPIGFTTKEDLDRLASGKATALYFLQSGIATYAIPIYRGEDL